MDTGGTGAANSITNTGPLMTLGQDCDSGRLRSPMGGQ